MEGHSRQRDLQGKGSTEEQGVGVREGGEWDESLKGSSLRILHAFLRSLDFTLLAVKFYMIQSPLLRKPYLATVCRMDQTAGKMGAGGPFGVNRTRFVFFTANI